MLPGAKVEIVLTCGYQPNNSMKNTEDAEI